MLSKPKLIKDKYLVFSRIKIDVKERRLPSKEYKAIRCGYCSLQKLFSCTVLCPSLILCNTFNFPSSQYPPRKYAYVIAQKKNYI